LFALFFYVLFSQPSVKRTPPPAIKTPCTSNAKHTLNICPFLFLKQTQTQIHETKNTKVCFRTLDLYTSAVLEAGLDAPPPPKAEWRALMDRLGRASCAVYRAYVFERPEFVEYFNLATPAQVRRF
jgi:hypothetical protein